MKSRGKRISLLAGAVVLIAFGLAAWLSWTEIRIAIHLWPNFESLGRNRQGYREYRHRQTGIIFVRLPGGTFWMGAQKEDPKERNYDPEAEDPETPVHEVTLSPFLIAKYEVTQAQWAQVMGENPSFFDGTRDWDGKPVNPPVGRDTLPVEQVSWDDIQEFDTRTGLTLPTEVQWEYACRVRKEGPFSGTGQLEEMGWFDENSGRRTHAVGEKQPNGFGIHDMHGNVFEWCEDIWDEEFYSKPEASRREPLCTAGSEYRVNRGGSWVYPAQCCRPAYRYGGLPKTRISFIGFRPVFAPLP